MTEPSSGAPPLVGMAPEMRLNSWKEMTVLSDPAEVSGPLAVAGPTTRRTAAVQ
jgi:hypothetical protein